MIIDEAFQSDDIGEAEQIARRVYPRAELRDSTGGHFHYEHLARGADGINFTRFKLNSQMDIAVEFDNVAAFGVRIAGRYAVESNDHRVDSSQPFLFTPGPGSSTSERLDVLMINVDTDVLAHSAARHLGVDRVRLRFDRHEPTSPAMRAHWLRTVNYAWNSVLQVRDVFANDAIRTATLDAVVASALAAFPIEVAASVRASELSTSAAIRRAQAFIEDSADRAVTVADIAEAARLSVRALQLGFQREFETTPMGYLRQVRLEAAREELLEADEDTRVADVARHWAFANVGRFAAQYRARFGENPGDTLRG
ncbi:helix-turn-helix transcriptional regulator [Gryllotalpicola koreensis]|uniref:HTH araC/xylS-type domain-containing protein n=1 Tax=Gryllotalpicola koreensis TaxID=993086 RepID=A0ABP8ADC0_9MICO